MTDFPTNLLFENARAIIARIAAEQALDSERLALSRTHGRVLAQDVVASMPLPPFDNSAMDGYAIRHCDLIGGGETALRLIGEQFAG
ncbi:MAG TPA: molybdopterin molybdenumtransferase MoeA, partial [Luteimonas sp.]|nr:molybdopterin molybdenumtransferase MoeA [Luteimonas sp.]